MRTAPPWQRIVVIGTSGSGKTTLGKALARHFGCRFIELDALHWQENWTPASPEAFWAAVAAATAIDEWVIDGGYSAVRERLWPQAQLIVWLDYPIVVNLWRLFWRACRRIRSGEELWNGNRESFRMNFLSRDSLFLWVLTTHRRRRRQYEALLYSPQYAAIAVVRLRSPKAADRWLADIRGK